MSGVLSQSQTKAMLEDVFARERGEGDLEEAGSRSAGEAHAKIIYRMTDNNDHQGALLYLAERVLKDKKLTSVAKGVQMIHNGVGHMPSELINFRQNVLYPRLMDLAKKKLSPEDYELIHGAF